MPLVRMEIYNRIAVVTIDNPPLNVLDVPTKESLALTFTELNNHLGEIRAVILTGSGGKAFAAGADLKSFQNLTSESAKKRLHRSHEIFAMIENFERPVIAAINGYCLGGGLELALSCDIRYADSDTKIGFPEVNLSIFPGNGGTKRALYHISLGKLKELIFSGKIINAEEACMLGLIEKIIPQGKVMEAAMELAAQISQKGPLGVASAKKVLNQTRDMAIASGLEVETNYWSELCDTEDMKEGIRAFMENRQPEFKCT